MNAKTQETSLEIRSQIDDKSIENQPKINQKSTKVNQNQPKMESGSATGFRRVPGDPREATGSENLWLLEALGGPKIAKNLKKTMIPARGPQTVGLSKHVHPSRSMLLQRTLGYST